MLDQAEACGAWGAGRERQVEQGHKCQGERKRGGKYLHGEGGQELGDRLEPGLAERFTALDHETGIVSITFF